MMGTTADWIDERPKIGQLGPVGFYPLCNYGTNTWTNCQTQDINGLLRNLNAYTNQQIYMWSAVDDNGNPTGNLLSLTSYLMSDGKSFTDYFVAAQ